MVTATHEALSVIEKAKPVTREDVLKMIPQFEIPPIFLRRHLIHREVVTGAIGDRGGGKSVLDSVLAATDCMFIGKTVLSNMLIAVNIEIDDETAMKYGMSKGGVAGYRSEKLEKDALLALDERLRGKALVIEEINVEYSNVRRFMSNTNVDFNEVCQQLRKFECPLHYNVIDEMFIDSQLRRLTDIFIKTYDTAFDIDSLNAQKPTGIDFCWYVYPVSGYLRGEQGKYENTKKAIGPVYLHYKGWRGIFDSYKHQKQGIYSISTRDKNKRLFGQITAESSEDMDAELNKNSWIRDLALQLKKRNIRELTSAELLMYAGRPLSRLDRQVLQDYGIFFDHSIQKYLVNLFELGNRARATPQNI